ncbi:hypothetical protein [Vibrio parahaemolyticus]|uniref:hypothetical protein n=1 Tax=Vibrio parahaemolyticus TaxID=670 RepID=UPI0005C649A2
MNELLHSELKRYINSVDFLEFNGSVNKISLEIMFIIAKHSNKMKKAFENDNLYDYYISNKRNLVDEALSIDSGNAQFRHNLNYYLNTRCLNHPGFKSELLEIFISEHII